MKVISFLGLIGYYCIFVKDFSQIATSLANLAKKTTMYEWTYKCEEAFQELKRGLTSASMLPLPTNDEDFVVYSDTSKNGLGCMLIQVIVS